MSADLLQRFERIEADILRGETTSVTWYGIEIGWERGALSRGASLKRKGQYGHLVYWNGHRRDYLDDSIGRLTREEAIKEITTLPVLRQAIIDAETIITCGHCGVTLIGQEARDARSHLLWSKGHPFVNQQQWSMFIRCNDRNNHGCYVICPPCAAEFIRPL